MIKKINDLSIIFQISLMALIAPLILIPIEKLLPYPYIIEELVKASFVIYILRLTTKILQFKTTVFAAFLFSLSENIFYLANFINDGIFMSFWQRIFFVSTLHITTTIIILYFAQKKYKYVFLGLTLAIIIHYIFNYYVITL